MYLMCPMEEAIEELAALSWDHWRAAARQTALSTRPPFVTTEAVLIEIGNALARTRWRHLGIAALQDLSYQHQLFRRVSGENRSGRGPGDLDGRRHGELSPVAQGRCPGAGQDTGRAHHIGGGSVRASSHCRGGIRSGGLE